MANGSTKVIMLKANYSADYIHSAGIYLLTCDNLTGESQTNPNAAITFTVHLYGKI